MTTNDYNREVIATRHSARIRLYYGTAESTPPEPGSLPPFLTAAEAVGLIAYGQSQALNGPAPGSPPVFQRWNIQIEQWHPEVARHPLVRAMQSRLARVRWWKLRKRAGQPVATCPTRPLDPETRDRIRRAIRSTRKSGVGTVALLRGDLRTLMAARVAHERKIAEASKALCAAAAEAKVTPVGRKGVWRKKLITGGMHEPIPREFFASPSNTILSDGWATRDLDLVGTNDVVPNGPDWGDVRFRREEVLSLLQATVREKVIRREEVHVDDKIRRFAEKQRRIRRWIPFTDIVEEWCGLDGENPDKPDPKKVADAYRALTKSLMRGDFESYGRTRVIYLAAGMVDLPRERRWFKMTRERFKALPLSMRDDMSGVSDIKTDYLRACWIPASMARAWFEDRRLPLPRWLPTHPGDDDFKPLATRLASCFDKPYIELPGDLRQRVDKRFLIPWDSLGPAQRRSVAQQSDMQWHPDLAGEIDALLEAMGKVAEIAERGRTTHDWKPTDFDSQEVRLRKARDAQADAEAALERKGQSLGLDWPDDRAKAATITRTPTVMKHPPLPAWLTPMQAVAWICTRNQGAVWRADLESEYMPEFGLDEAMIEEWFPRGKGVTTLTLDAWHGRHVSAHPWVLNHDEAQGCLMDWLRADELRSTGIDASGEEVSLTSKHWRRWRLAEGRDSRELVLEWAPPLCGLVRDWSGILICRKGLMTLCPPISDAVVPAPQMVEASSVTEKPQIGQRTTASATTGLAALPLPPDYAPIPNKPGGGGVKHEGAVKAMVEAVTRGTTTIDELRRWPVKTLDHFYSGARRTALTIARKAALAELARRDGAA